MGRKGNINNGRFALGLLFGSPLLFMPFPNLHCGAGRFGKGAEQLNQSCAGQEHNGDKQNQKTARTFFASIDQPEEDNQGRFILDPSLRKFADIKKGVVFVGVGNRIELWSEERWNEYNNLDNPEAFDEAFVDLEKYGV